MFSLQHGLWSPKIPTLWSLRMRGRVSHGRRNDLTSPDTCAALPDPFPSTWTALSGLWQLTAMPALEAGVLTAGRDPHGAPNMPCWNGDPLGISLRPCPVPFLPHPIPPHPQLPPDSCALGSPEASSILHPSFSCQTRARRERSASRPREDGHPGVRRPAVPLRPRKDNAQQNSLGVLGGFHARNL